MNSVSLSRHAFQARCLLLVLFFGALSGCATGLGVNPKDPLEPWNRGVTKFNDDLDRVVAVPLAIIYNGILPHFVRTGVNNFFENLTSVWSAVNMALQLKPQAAVETVMRFTTNSVLGLGGVLDIAGEMNIERHKADFGQTLGYWGVPAGPYLVIPFLGPSTMRDTLASTLIAKGDLVWQLKNVPDRNALYALRLIDKRSNLLRTTAVLDAIALDKYSFTRDIFLQLRQNEVFDGNVPDEVNFELDNSEKKPEPKPDIKSEIDLEGLPVFTADGDAEDKEGLPFQTVQENKSEKEGIEKQ